MDRGFQNWLVGELQRGHKHESMTDKLKCSSCGDHFQEVRKIYDKETRKDPSLVSREREFKRSPEYAEMAQQLVDRVKRDPLYKKHLYKSAFGTPEEKALEARRANSGYYKKHSELGKRFI